MYRQIPEEGERWVLNIIKKTQINQTNALLPLLWLRSESDVSPMWLLLGSGITSESEISHNYAITELRATSDELRATSGHAARCLP